MRISQPSFTEFRLPRPSRVPYVAVRRQTTGCRIEEKTMTTLKTIAEKLQAWRKYREAVRELSALTDRELSDIGIRRGDIEYIVRRTASAA